MPEASIRVGPAHQPAKTLGPDKPVVICLGAIFVINALDAYSIGPVPTSWIAQILTLALFVLVVIRRRLNYPPGVVALQVFVLALVALTLFNVAMGDYRELMPAAGTTGYFVYIGLRILTLVNFIAAYIVVYDVLSRGTCRNHRKHHCVDRAVHRLSSNLYIHRAVVRSAGAAKDEDRHKQRSSRSRSLPMPSIARWELFASPVSWHNGWFSLSC